VPDDYFCPGCGNYSQKEPGNCPLCRTPLETLGEVNVNDDSLEDIDDGKDIFDDDLDDDLAPSRVKSRKTTKCKDNIDEN
jgi:predicted ATP-dependent serine protease